jgi:hypothetical protein
VNAGRQLGCARDGWDSLKHINITVAADIVFEIRFKSADLEELRNVGDFVASIQTKLGKIVHPDGYVSKNRAYEVFYWELRGIRH